MIFHIDDEARFEDFVQYQMGTLMGYIRSESDQNVTYGRFGRFQPDSVGDHSFSNCRKTFFKQCSDFYSKTIK